ncbi:MAG: ExeM/NucH family extracellular endonuclease [Chloroflexi bacterium]|nr:ExeM/NucH family extracellular endonuclease [Chloroflexota bacterium]
MGKFLNRLFASVIIFMMILALIPAQFVSAATSELFFSEIIEGTGNNKAIEIYNGTGAAVNLATGGYNIQMHFNGSPVAGLTINLTGTVADGDVFVVAQSTANATILAQADQLNGSGWFNGDDAVLLRKGTDVIDVIGQAGFDPGTEWGTLLTSTADNTLTRKSSICAGDVDGSNVFDPSIEWDGFATDTFSGLGIHVADCGVVEPKLNEFSASTTGADVEYVEVFGAPNKDYSAYKILEIEGDTAAASGVVDEVIAVGTTDANGLWLGNLPANTLENGTLSLLLVKNFTGALTNDLDTNNDGVFDVTPWDALIDSVAVNDGGAGDITYGIPTLGVSYDGLSFAPGGASRIPDGFDTESAANWVRNDFDLAGITGFTGTPIVGEAFNTPGALNAVFIPPPEMCGDSGLTLIHDIQGNGLASPIVGAEVAIEAIVVGDFQNNTSMDNGNLNGFYVQEEDAEADADPSTSEGIFVFAPSSDDVSVGDKVRVRGNVTEFNGLTEIGGVTLLLQCSTANALPASASVNLPVASVNDFEAFEGMAVTMPQALVISEYFNFDRFGEIVLTSERHLTPTAEFEPGPDAIQAAQNFLLDRITLDDGRSAQNPNPAIHPNGSVFDLNNLFRGGDTVQNVTGVMDFSFGLYRIQPTQGADYTSLNARTTQPDDVGGNIKVASFNVLNYFTTIDTGALICGPSANQECRGADNATELARQRAKIVSALSAINADVVGLFEIENNVTDVATADLVSGLNDIFGAGTYDYIATGAIGTDAIRLAIIYKTASVSPVGSFAVLNSTVDPRFIDTKNRPSLAQSFFDTNTGGIFTVAINHLKSKGSDCNDVADPDLGDGAGNCNLTRKAAASALVDWLATDPTASGDTDYLIIGDLNSYDKEDPIDAIQAGPDDVLGTSDDYTDMVFQFQGEDAYSYVFDGQTGYLDHALASAGLAGQITGVTDWHINSDEPDLIDYDTSFKQAAQDAIYAPDAYRSSDHDPVIIGLDLEISPRPAKQYVLDSMTVLRATVTNKKDAQRLDEAIKKLTRSLDPALWVDDNHVDSNHGHQVFGDEKDSVSKLNEILKDSNSSLSQDTIRNYISFMVNADRMLAQTAVNDAIANSGDPKDIEKAQENIAEGDAFLTAGKTESAIERYREAWKKAIQALK